MRNYRSDPQLPYRWVFDVFVIVGLLSAVGWVGALVSSAIFGWPK